MNYPTFNKNIWERNAVDYGNALHELSELLYQEKNMSYLYHSSTQKTKTGKIVSLAVTGANKEDIKVTFQSGKLEVFAATKIAGSSFDYRYSFDIGENYRVDKTKYKNGILEIHFELREESLPMKIEIN